MHGCIVALLIFAALAVMVLLGGGFVLWRAWKTPDGQRMAKIVGDTAKLTYGGLSAPGAKEVRRAGRCEQSFVMTPEAVATLGNDLRDGGLTDGGVAVPTARTPAMVLCQVSIFITPPTCESLAEVYAAAAHPKAPFVVTVQKTGSLSPVCTQTFDRHGSPLTPN